MKEGYNLIARTSNAGRRKKESMCKDDPYISYLQGKLKLTPRLFGHQRKIIQFTN